MEANDKIIGHFDLAHIRRNAKIPLICIYESPEDYPGQFVARLWDMNKPTKYIACAASLEEIRNAIPEDMIPFQRDLQDHPCIVETWI